MPTSKPSGCLPAVFRVFGIGANRGFPPRCNPSIPQASRPNPTPVEEIKDEPLPYKRKDWLFSKAERSFFGVLQQAVGTDHLIFAKIRVGDLLWLPKATEGYMSHWNRIQSKHIDFVLCDRDSVKPLLAIELDDSSHDSEKRKARDIFVDEALKTAGLPLLRVSCKAGYSVNDLREQIRRTLA